MNCLKKFKNHIVFSVIFVFSSFAWAGSFEGFFQAAVSDNESVVVGLALRGFDLNTRNEDGDPALTVALREGSRKVAAFLLTQRSVNVGQLNKAGESPLMIASIKGEIELARALIRRGADVNKPGWTPLHYAASRPEPDSLDLVRLLLENYAYIDAESPNRTTPLMMAAMYGEPDVVRMLLEEGADVSLRNDQGLTAVDFARRANRQDLADLMAARLRNTRNSGR